MKILIAEDESALSRALTVILNKNGYETDTAENGLEAVELAKSGSYDAFVFDIMMPEMDGVEALRHLRESGDTTPAIFLTAKSELDDRITGLDAGADDYLTKPFAMGELLARLRSLTRRAGAYSPKKLSFGKVTLDITEQEMSCENSIRLASKESRLMEYLMHNRMKLLSHEDIFRHVWGGDEETDKKMVHMYTSFLSSKLMSIGADIVIEETEEGVILREADIN